MVSSGYITACFSDIVPENLESILTLTSSGSKKCNLMSHSPVDSSVVGQSHGVVTISGHGVVIGNVGQSGQVSHSGHSDGVGHVGKVGHVDVSGHSGHSSGVAAVGHSVVAVHGAIMTKSCIEKDILFGRTFSTYLLLNLAQVNPGLLQYNPFPWGFEDY